VKKKLPADLPKPGKFRLPDSEAPAAPAQPQAAEGAPAAEKEGG
jgi:large subunit ribosomal protein L3